MLLKWPKVTVVCSTYKRPEMLAHFLDSVLAQDFDDFEVIVVDDAGEQAKDVVAEYRDRFAERGVYCYLIVMQENSGYQSRPKNIGIAHARGSYVAQADDDDVWYPWHLRTLVGVLEDGNCDIAYGSWDFGGDREGEQWEYIPFNHITANLVLNSPMLNFVSCHTVWSKAAVLTHLGPKPWNENIRRFGDWDLYNRAIRSGLRLKGTWRRTYKYMWHGKNLQTVRPLNESGVDARAGNPEWDGRVA